MRTTRYIRPYFFILMTLMVLCGVSCSKWLDIHPESEIDRSILFSTEQGFKEALIGVYGRGAKSDLYGKELTIGTLEVLAQNYNISSSDPFRYAPTRRYEYNDADFIARKDSIWQGLYHGIVNSNLILTEIDRNRSLFTSGNYELIKGEALALRAYFHFDLLRMFAPSFQNGASADAIPYVSEYSNQTTRISTVSAVLDSVIRDLEDAKNLLQDDPITQTSYIVGYPVQSDTTLNTETTHPDLFLQNRRHRMNYYAVCATLARVYLYKDDNPNALINALEVIDSNKFPWTNPTDFLAIDAEKKDRIMYKELIFGWYIPSMNNTYNTNWFTSGSNGMHLTQEEARIIYETSGSGGGDMRFTQWFNTVSSNNVFYSEIHKYRRNNLSDNDQANLHYMIAPAIRLSEMYYIAAESSYQMNPAQARSYIDAVRLNRGIGQPLTAPDLHTFQEELLKEYRKETFAEGQLFYAYKRLNHAIMGHSGALIPADDAIFVLPLPDDEKIYGER